MHKPHTKMHFDGRAPSIWSAQAGVIIHQLDGLERITDDKLWEMCPGDCFCQVRPTNWPAALVSRSGYVRSSRTAPSPPESAPPADHAIMLVCSHRVAGRND